MRRTKTTGMAAIVTANSVGLELLTTMSIWGRLIYEPTCKEATTNLHCDADEAEEVKFQEANHD